MASLNRVTILGNLGQDPELRYTANQTPVVSLSVATTDFRKTPDGQRQDHTEWHRIVVWGRQAENCHKYLKKGRSVLVEGRISYRSWDDKSGQKRYNTDIVASNVQFMPAAGGRDASWQSGGDSARGGDYAGYMPEGDPFAGSFGTGAAGQEGAAPAPQAPQPQNGEQHTSFPKADSQGGPASGGAVPDFDDMPF